MRAAISLPALFSSGMVLQQNTSVVFWGWAKPDEEVSIVLGWNKQTVKTRAGVDARWRVEVATPQAGGPYEIVFLGTNLIRLADVWLGEVWYFSGQSNMEWSARSGIQNGETLMRQASHENIRLFRVEQAASAYEQLDCKGKWEKCTPVAMQDFSAVAYLTGKSLSEKLKVPIGLIQSTWGGTNIETWMHPSWIQADPLLEQASSKILPTPWGPVAPGEVYQAMVAPLIPYRIAGMCWYQGECNVINAEYYAPLLKAMVAGYRKVWQAELPFLYVQIAPCNYDQPLGGAELRFQQSKALEGIIQGNMVVISDVGDVGDIHPRNKSAVGDRLAAQAMQLVYGDTLAVVNGPTLEYYRIENGKIELTFSHVADGLQSPTGAITCFALAGPDRIYYEARATIAGKNRVVVDSKKVKQPVAVRFAFTNTAEPNLFNSAGLPASCFRTDNWPLR